MTGARPLAGKAAIVSGGGRGLGRAIALRLARDGADVAILSRSPEPLAEALDALLAAGGSGIGIVCDVMTDGALALAVAEAKAAFGKIDILVNNAHDTAIGSMTAPFNGVTVAQAMHQFASGPVSTMVAMQACFPHFPRPGGRVINMGSTAAVKGLANFLPYTMAKEAIRGLTRVAAREWGQYGITVNAVCPVADTEAARATVQAGVVVATGGPAIPRFGSAETDVAPLVAFLAGDEAGYLTGYTFMADGGGAIDAAR